MKFTLFDTFNNRVISRHKSLRMAVIAQMKHSRAVKRTNGQNSYIPTSILCDGYPLNESQRDEVWEIQSGRV